MKLEICQRKFPSTTRNVTHCGSENCNVKMQHLAKLETHQRFYYIAKCVEGGVLLGAEQLCR